MVQPGLEQGETGYVKISAPAGLTVTQLPEGCNTIIAGEKTYYVSDGTFYERTQRDGKTVYMVVTRPSGSR